MQTWVHQLPQTPKWKKYSQAYEECYIEAILKNIHPAGNLILELGAWDGYHLSNTRFLIEQGYEALLIDGDNRGNAEVKQHFITRENIVPILTEYNWPDRFDLMCIDLDGNDYYVMDEVLRVFKPNVIVAEFNPVFAMHESKAIQYNPNHVWNNDDYYGFSFKAGLALADEHGYTCIFQNDNLNMYFVRNSVLAESLGVGVDDLSFMIPVPTYQVSQYHPASKRTDWVVIE